MKLLGSLILKAVIEANPLETLDQMGTMGHDSNNGAHSNGPMEQLEPNGPTGAPIHTGASIPAGPVGLSTAADFTLCR